MNANQTNTTASTAKVVPIISRGSRVLTRLGMGTVLKVVECDPVSLCPAAKVRLDVPARYKMQWFNLSQIMVETTVHLNGGAL